MSRARRSRFRPAGRAALACALLTLSGCSYIGDRALDFLDQYRVNIGAGTTVGIRGRTLGLIDTGLMFGVKPRAAALGWKYGAPLYFNENDLRIDADQAEIIKTTSLLEMDYSDGSYHSARNSFFLLPAILTWGDGTPKDIEWVVPEEGDEFDDRYWLWSSESFTRNRWGQIHAFDTELEAGLIVYLDLGYSPGEFVDFVLGIFLIDIAADDGRL